MKRNTLLVLLAVAVLGLSILFLPASFAEKNDSSRNHPKKSRSIARPSLESELFKSNGQQGSAATPIVRQAVNFGESIPVREMPAASGKTSKAFKNQVRDRELASGDKTDGKEINEKNREIIRRIDPNAPGTPDAAIARVADRNAQTPLVMPTPNVSFEGISEVDTVGLGQGFLPPDTNGEIGPSHYVQTVNSAFRIYNRTGTALIPLTSLGTLFAGIPGPCAGNEDGDPVVVYDQLADRWLISEFCTVANPNNHQLIAISKTGDPTGAYYLYDFMMPNNDFNDYPKFGVWPDAYYMTDNEFNQAGTSFLGAGVFAFNRAKMIAGDPTASFVYFDNNAGCPADCVNGGMLPADLDGLTPPAIGTPAPFAQFDADEFGGGRTDSLRLYDFHVDFVTPALSTFTERAGSPLAVAAFDPREVPAGSRNVVPQPAGGVALDVISDRLMFRLAYRNFGTYESLALNHTVNVLVNPAFRSGVRYYEIRRATPAAAWTVNEQATMSGGGGDTENRWMGSTALNFAGSQAVGYSVSSSTVFPSIRYAGRLIGDPAGSLAQGEATLVAGAGVQTHSSGRWGDYSDLSVDPVDDCTFWYTQEYYSVTGTAPWHTRIGSFTFGSCPAVPKGTISGTITNCQTGLPVPNALVSITGGFLRATDASGNYSASVPTGTYSATATTTGYDTLMASGLVVTNGGNATFSGCLNGNLKQPVADTASVTADSCNSNGFIDPNEVVTVSLGIKNTGTQNTVSLVGTLQATGGVTSPSGPQAYNVVVAGGATVFKSFSFTAGNLACGAPLVITLQLQDGATNFGNVIYNFTTGQQLIGLTENFDGVVAPALPAGWVAANASGAAPLWVTSTTTPDSAPNDAFIDDPATVSDKRLDSPNISITSAAAQVTFRNNYNMESTFDGGVLEVSSPNINAGAFTDITNAAVGGSFVSGGYNSSISASFGNPLAGRMAWTGNSGGYITTVANLGPNVNGQTIKLRWRMGSDTSVAGTGWRVDSIMVSNGFVCCGPLINATPPPVITAESISPANNAPDPEETVTANFTLTNVGVSPTSNLVATLLPTGGVAGPSGPQTYGVIASLGGTGTKPFTFTAQGACGNNITATFALQDGALSLGTVSFTMQLGTTAPSTTSFSNATSITIPATGTGASTGSPATPYPSTINVTGLTGTISKVTVDLKGLNHTFPSDVDVLLVGPGGQKFIIMSDVIGGTDWVNINYTLDDAAAAVIPSSGAPVSGTFKPTNYGTGDAFPAPAPVAPYQTPATAGSATFASVFNGTNPNGNWDLYVVDDAGGDIGTFSGGWTINITTAVPVCNSQSCTLMVPSNITIPPGTCGTIVNYAPPVSFTGACGVVTTTPASGSFFGIGTTTVNVVGTNGPTMSSFTVTVQDSETLATGSGSNILNNFCDTTVKYANVTAPGSTTVVDAPAQTLPAGFTHCTSCPELNISTTATFTGNVTTCVTMPASTDFSTFSRLRLLHGEPVTLVNRTTSSNFGTKTICAVTTSVSPFVVALNTNAPTAAPARISGRIVTSDGQPLGGVALSLSGGTSARAISNSDGYYSFENVATNTFYTVTPDRANFSFSPRQRSFSLVADKTDAVFTATADATQTVNPIDSNMFFVRQQYLDFLGREPDADGLNYWTDQLDRCGSDANCLRQRRREVSAAFFMSDEFQQSGSYLLGLYRAALGRQISFAEYSTDRSHLVGGAQLETNKVAFTNEWVQRADFQQQYPKTLSNAEFVNRLFDTAGSFSTAERQQAIELLNQGGTRAQVVRGLVDSDSFRQREYNGAFVLMEYFGYLGRDRDQGGYDFWLNVLNNREPGNYRGMVCSFITAAEYQRRFGTVVTHTNAECSQ